MDDWAEKFLNYSIRAIMTAPRGQPSPNLLNAFHRAYSQHEMAKCFCKDKKINAVDSGAKKRPFTTGGIIA